MPHEISLISTIAVSLAYALLGGTIAVRLRLPPLVGYLLAGIAVGPFTLGFVADAHLAPQLAEIGVMLLMFGVGMHFSLADLMAVRACLDHLQPLHLRCRDTQTARARNATRMMSAELIDFRKAINQKT